MTVLVHIERLFGNIWCKLEADSAWVCNTKFPKPAAYRVRGTLGGIQYRNQILSITAVFESKITNTVYRKISNIVIPQFFKENTEIP